MDRRTTLKWIVAAAATAPSLREEVLAQIPSAPPVRPPAKGYGTDPDLMKVYKAGELWPLTLTRAQRRAATALSDLIIPADGESPAASTVGVIDFIDEWISAPYPRHAEDRKVIIDGLTWMEAQAMQRFQKDFAALTESQQRAICDEICYLPKVKGSRLGRAAEFFARYRDLTAGGFYTTPAGRKDLKYMGNVPRATFEGPPPEVLKKVGLA